MTQVAESLLTAQTFGVERDVLDSMHEQSDHLDQETSA